ncbi:MAG TPA: SIMPL domain-containing protein, partial [Hanamia sp.]|nr:SIMPL domain-containing protein [Hanamia sp.]
ISREATELIEKGIEFNSQAPLFYYTKLTEIKMDLLAKASADGKQRAEIIAKNAGSSLGKLKNANLGVFQITGKNTDEDFSYGGTFNTSSKNKTGSITIRMEFAVN